MSWHMCRRQSETSTTWGLEIELRFGCRHLYPPSHLTSSPSQLFYQLIVCVLAGIFFFLLFGLSFNDLFSSNTLLLFLLYSGLCKIGLVQACRIHESREFGSLTSDYQRCRTCVAHSGHMCVVSTDVG